MEKINENKKLVNKIKEILQTDPKLVRKLEDAKDFVIKNEEKLRTLLEKK